MVDVCHNGVLKSIDISILDAHLNHGDVQLIDDDNDGYYTEANNCGLLVDCDDTDALVTSCVTIAIGNPHPTYGGFVFEVDGQGGGKLVDSTPLKGANFGYVDVQHDISWTMSSSDGYANTAALALVHPNFDPIRYSISKGPTWYMPSIEELEIIYNEIFATGIAFDPGVYLSSTDAGSSQIQAYYFHLTQAEKVEYSHYGDGAYTFRVRSF